MPGELWWYVARASGITSWVLLAAATLWGLALSTRVLGLRPNAAWLTDLHRFLGGLAVVFTGVHVAALVADSYTHWGLTDVLVPFASSWRPGPTALGIVAFYLLAAVELTSLAQRRLPKRWWVAVHRSSAVLFVAATAHLLTAGADRTNRLLLGSVWVVAVASAFLVVVRLTYRHRAERARVRAVA